MYPEQIQNGGLTVDHFLKLIREKVALVDIVQEAGRGKKSRWTHIWWLLLVDGCSNSSSRSDDSSLHGDQRLFLAGSKPGSVPDPMVPKTFIPKFFNRLLALDVASQDLLFEFFENIFTQVREDQEAAGRVS